MKKITRWLLILIFFCLSFFCIKAEANSAPTHWFGTDSQGVIVKGENCPLEVINEDLTFHITDLKNSISNLEMIQSTVSAKYTFYNPASYDVSATLVFPFGRLPDYLAYIDDSTGDYKPIDDTSKYDITINNQPIDKKLRYTYCESNEFDVTEAVLQLKDDFIEDSFYKKDLEVHKVTLKVKDAGSHIQGCLAYAPEEPYRISTNYEYMENGKKKPYIFWFDSNQTATIYFLGKLDPKLLEQIKYYEDGSLKKEKQGTIYIDSTTVAPLEDYIYKYYKEESGISRVDWFNASIERLNAEKGFMHEAQFDISYALMRWYEYKLVVPEKQQAVNEVIAPLYPDIDESYKPEIYTFTYLLSPASTWAGFHRLNIRIYTEYYITESLLGEFEKCETYYELIFNQLPHSELVFSVSNSQNPKKIRDILDVVSALILLFIIAVPFAVLFISLIISGKKKDMPIQLKRIKACYFIGFSLSIGLFILGVLGMFLFNTLSIFCMIVALGLLALHLIERFKLRNNNAGRMVTLVFMLIFMIFCFSNSTISESFEDVNAVSIAFGLGFALIFLVKLSLFNRHVKDKDVVYIPNLSPKNKYYPIGYLSRKWSIILWVGLSIWAISFILVFSFAFHAYDRNILWIIIGFFLLLLVFSFVFGFTMTMVNEKEFRVFYKDLDYDKLEAAILKKVNDPKINPETINYFKMKLSVYASLYSLDRYHELEAEIFIPENKGYRLQYEIRKVNFLLTEEEMNAAIDQLLKLYPTKGSIKRSAMQFKNLWSAYYNGNIIGSIDNVAPYQTKNEYMNSMHLFIQIAYYKHKNNWDKAEELERLFKEKYSMLKVLMDELDGINIRKNTSTSILEVCPTCGKRIRKEDIFCSTCGTKLGEELEKNEIDS